MAFGGLIKSVVEQKKGELMARAEALATPGTTEWAAEQRSNRRAIAPNQDFLPSLIKRRKKSRTILSDADTSGDGLGG